MSFSRTVPAPTLLLDSIPRMLKAARVSPLATNSSAPKAAPRLFIWSCKSCCFHQLLLFTSAATVELGVDTVEVAVGVANISCSASACKCSANSVTLAGKGVVSRANACRMPATRKAICDPPTLHRESDHFDSRPISSSGSGS